MRLPAFLARWFIRSMAAIGIVFLVVTFSPLVYWWATALAGPWNDPPGDVLIVLTGSGLEDGTLGMSSYWRAVNVLLILRNEQFREVLITGGGDGKPAESMRRFIVAQGVPAGIVRLENRSTTTRESAINVAALVAAGTERYRDSRLVLVTSDYHMYRSHRAFQKAGVTVAPRPIPDIRKRYSSYLQRWGMFQELLLETAKIGYYWIRGWI
jgi:uncharacterized SAM-binding protein YcdF (DUF218 family)